MSWFDDVVDVGIGSIPLVGPAYTAMKNRQSQQQQFDYSKELQQQMFQREDNAVQRRKADLIAAGLSPVLAAGSAASAGPVVSTNAPQLQNMPDSAQIMMSMIKMKNDISMTDAQKELMRKQQEQLDTQIDKNKADAAISWNDYKIFKNTGTPSNSSGTVKTIRDILGLGTAGEGTSTKVILDQIAEKLQNDDRRRDSIINEIKQKNADRIYDKYPSLKQSEDRESRMLKNKK